MYEAVTLYEVKNWLNIDQTETSKDGFLESLRTQASRLVEHYTGKALITREFTEYHDGARSVKILTHKYPIYSVGSLYDDLDHVWPDSSRVLSTDFRIHYDTGIVHLTGDEYKFMNGQENVKITYRSGLSRYRLIDESNNYIDIRESTSSTDYAVELTPPTAPIGNYTGYDAEGIASALQTALRASTDLTLAYLVTFNHITQDFTISASTDFNIKWLNGTNTGKNMAGLFGFSTNTDTQAGSSHTSTSSDFHTGLPDDLKVAVLYVIHFLYEESVQGKNRMMDRIIALPHGEGSQHFIKELPKVAQMILETYRGLA